MWSLDRIFFGIGSTDSMAIAAIMDNPYQNIRWRRVFRFSLVGLDEEEMAQIGIIQDVRLPGSCNHP